MPTTGYRFMLEYAEPVTKLIDELKRLPGIGHKSAQRLAFHLLRAERLETDRLIAAIIEVKERIILCSVCNNITDVDPCRYCTSPARDKATILVVEEPFNIVAFEKTREYKGLYHVLHGALSPIRGMGPDDLKIKNLLERLRAGEVNEIILATNPNTEGEATANYLSKLLRPLGIRITRIAMGIPVGSDLEYADEVTMHKALANRHEM
jgi:recombination protein RecR